VKLFGLVYKTREINGKVYHHLMMPAELLEVSPQEQPESEVEVFLLGLVSKLNTHLYWVEEEGYFIFAGIPQGLFDRQLYEERVPIQQWLKQEQRQDIQSSLFFISTTLSDTPRQLYYAYLQTLIVLAELADAEMDLFSLPSAMELNLPKNGTYGMQLDISDSLLSLEFTFENNPLEFLLSADMTSVALIGILAAVAVPAYSDYLKRAKVSEGVSLLGDIKAPATEFFANYGRLPEVEEIGAVTSGKYSQNLQLLHTQNGYSIEFEDPAISGKLILFYDAQNHTWICTHDGINEKYLPSNCR
jgi:Tfp pilus assembly major pilin PilA